MPCISRVTNDTYSQKFGNNHNKFYVEMRCNLPASSDICSKCKDKTSKIQTSHKFDHGTINDPIPDISHIYGSKWYYDAVKKYGEPSKDSIAFAEEYKLKARSVQPVQSVKPVKPVKPVQIPVNLVHKDIVIPTHIETKMEEIDGCQIEYVHLDRFEHNGVHYFKDGKNKLYKNIRDKIGPYIGRFHKDSIIDFPDSDESDEE